MKKNIINQLTKLITRKYNKIFVISIVLAIISVFFVLKIELITDYVYMMPENMQSVKNVHKLTEEMGGLGFFYVVLYFEDEQLVKELQKTRSAKNKAENEYEELKDKYDSLKSAFDEANTDYKRKKRRLKYLDESNEQYEKQKSLLEDYFKQMQSAKSALENFTNEYGSPEDENSVISRAKKEYDETLSAFEKVDKIATARVDKAKSFTDNLVVELRKIEEVRYIDYKVDVDFIEDHLLLYLDTEDLEKLNSKLFSVMSESTGLYIDFRDEEDTFSMKKMKEKYADRLDNTGDNEYYVDEDKKMLALFVKPMFNSTDTEKTKQFEKKVLAAIDKVGPKNYLPELEIKFNGGYKLALDERNAIEASFRYSSILALFLIVLSLLFFFRRFAYMINIIIALACGLLWTFALTYLIIGKITVVTSFLVAILLGLGVDFGVHFTSRYNEERSKGEEVAESVKIAFKQAGIPSFTGMITTAGGFLTLAFSNFKAFHEFGIISGIGMILIFIAMHSILIALLVKFVKFEKPVKPLFKKDNQDSLKDKRYKYPVQIIVGSVIITILAGYFAVTKLEFEYNAKNLQVEGQTSIQVDEDIQENFKMSPDPSIYITYNLEDTKKLYDVFNPQTEAEKQAYKNQFSDVENFLCILDVYPYSEKREANLEQIRKIRNKLDKISDEKLDEDQKDEFDRLRKMAEVEQLEIEDLPELFKYRFLGIDLGKTDEETYLSYVYPDHTLWDGKELIKYVDQIDDIEITKGENEGKKPIYPTGNHVLFRDVIKLVISEGKIFFFVVLGVIALLLLIDLRKLKATVLSLLPLLIGVIWMLGLMAIIGIKINYLNMCVLPIILGMGVDNGVHIYHRYRNSSSVMEAVKSAGGAVIISSVTTMFGWGALLIASYRGVQSMGSVALLGVGACLITSLTILPAILQIAEDKK